MLARNFLAVAAAGGLAMGTLTGLAWHPQMKMAPLRPWQTSARVPDDRDFTPVQSYRDAIPVALPLPPTSPMTAPMPRLALAADVVPQRPMPHEESWRPAREDARRLPEDDATIATTPEDPPPADEPDEDWPETE
ncbi:MAG: hypothetical protein KGM17_02260 [Sphingomonadales bacterium]|nr:hypothetical protein [Sphingomonadales bacterium]